MNVQGTSESRNVPEAVEEKGNCVQILVEYLGNLHNVSERANSPGHSRKVLGFFQEDSNYPDNILYLGIFPYPDL